MYFWIFNVLRLLISIFDLFTSIIKGRKIEQTYDKIQAFLHIQLNCYDRYHNYIQGFGKWQKEIPVFLSSDLITKQIRTSKASCNSAHVNSILCFRNNILIHWVRISISACFVKFIWTFFHNTLLSNNLLLRFEILQCQFILYLLIDFPFCCILLEFIPESISIQEYLF